ncbi:putative C6 transcription factor [Nemania sp. FL0916]|nr:putative C6 transcription factor [Nemania sp. FL0916]
MTGSQFVPIAPRPYLSSPGGDDDDPSPGGSRQSNKLVHIACDPCRRSKIKCDGERPSCYKCRSRGRDCVYEFPHDETSRASASKKVITQLRNEVYDLRGLFHHLTHGTHTETDELLRRLRHVEDPIGLARSIRQAELLLPNPGVTYGVDENATMEQIESSALEGSPIKVPGRPWTSVAGDGIVSELVSSWFRWEHPFLYPFIDRDAFIHEMRQADPDTAKHCSPFLVNVICSMRSFFSGNVQTAARITQKNMSEAFLHEAMRLYDHGLPSLPTIQGLWIMFGISMLQAQDRPGSVYRLASSDMLRRMNPERGFANLSGADAQDATTKRTISRTAWGIFCLESLSDVSFPVLDRISTPDIPRLFSNGSEETNADLLGNIFEALSPQPPIVAGISTALCSLAEILNRVTVHNSTQTVETSEDGKLERLRFYSEVQEFGRSLPPTLRAEDNFIPQTCFLRIFMNITIYTLMRPLPLALLFDQEAGQSVKEIILIHCTLDTDLLEKYFSIWTRHETSSMVITALLSTGIALLRLLPDEKAEEIFVRTCRLLHTFSPTVIVANYILTGWQAALSFMEVEIPQAALPYFQNLNVGKDGLRDIPSNLQVALISRDQGEKKDEGGRELGELLLAWSLSRNE